MRLAIVGGGGVRTPLLLQALVERQERLGLDEVVLLDLDRERLDLLAALCSPMGKGARFTVGWTTAARDALEGADFVITTFRVGGMEARVVDERVPLAHGILGQETTGPGGFAMALRSIPVLIEYLHLMRECCPHAWLINFANPAGMLAEAATRAAGWDRAVGICDAPQEIGQVAAALLQVPVEEVFLDYFGLNHLGWARAVRHGGSDYLPSFLDMVRRSGRFPGDLFPADLVLGLGLIPNEYLFYYYRTDDAIANIRKAGRTRGEEIVTLNTQLFAELRQRRQQGDLAGMTAAYRSYLRQRTGTYMAAETGRAGAGMESLIETSGGGYAGIALDLIEALAGLQPRAMVLNLPNRGAIADMGDDEVVEVPAYVGRGLVRPLAVGQVPDHCLGLMKQVKAYERLTIGAAVEGCYEQALQALALHPLVPDVATARAILDDYREKHGALFPRLR